MSTHLSRIYSFFKSDVRFLIVLILLFVILRIPSLIEPSWYGDEGIYQVIGRALREGRGLYTEIWDNKPPLLYLIYAIANSDLYMVKMFSIFFGAVSIFSFYKLARLLFEKRFPSILSTTFFGIAFALPILEGNIANAENFFLLPVISAMYFFVRYLKTHTAKYLAFAGVLLSVGFLFKTVVVFDVAAVVFILAAVSARKTDEIVLRTQLSLQTLLKNRTVFIFFGIAFAALPLLTALYFLVKGAFIPFFVSTFLSNIDYVGQENSLGFPMGMLFLKVIILGSILFLIFYFRQKLTFTHFFILVWLAWSLFSAYFSDRPYIHYMLVLLPATSLLIGSLAVKDRLLKIKILVLICLFLVVNYRFEFYKKNIPYYTNYISYIAGSKSIDEYQSFFDRVTPSYYSLAQFIQSHTESQDEILYWGDGGQVYYLANKLPPSRYIVAYHITFLPGALEETQRAVLAKKPKYIIQSKQDPEFNSVAYGYELKYRIDGSNIYERQL